MHFFFVVMTSSYVFTNKIIFLTLIFFPATRYYQAYHFDTFTFNNSSIPFKNYQSLLNCTSFVANLIFQYTKVLKSKAPRYALGFRQSSLETINVAVMLNITRCGTERGRLYASTLEF